MSNKIHGYGQPQLPVAKSTQNTPTERVARSDGQPVQPVTPAHDTVSLTDTSLLMQRLEEAVAKAASTDTSHVQQVKDALSRNEYVVDAQRVADKMLKLERDLAPRK